MGLTSKQKWGGGCGCQKMFGPKVKAHIGFGSCVGTLGESMMGTTCWKHWIQVEYDLVVLMVGCMVNPWLTRASKLRVKIVRKIIWWTWDSNPGLKW